MVSLLVMSLFSICSSTTTVLLRFVIMLAEGDLSLLQDAEIPI